ncbi:MotA/TolQ/ExbB proton channel family protein [Aureisphaera sp. CAU 1614]|uniref:MotA/TolQ/ExbB proton channel family protein n=1 Tax=Halomarinibacterium sedimenti TaxID=2857106 RepID=A0A9X1FPN7_9FLAO|nr:MotA/TolQ/ExbB proton channel family protein [Halomarinibacterium sedimenti]MBW2937542.1 MotA/TolQ/ExbB proton channel family protein [Halomarinibacterium sedimenti]
MKIEVIEIILVCLIVSIQLFVFIRTFVKIQLFKKIIPRIDLLFVTKVLLPISDLESLSPKEILENIEKYKEVQTNQNSDEVLDSNNNYDLFNRGETINDNILKTEVNFIEINGKLNQVFEKILFSLNNYLIRNRGAASDFNLMKDIVERNTDAIEEDINLSIGTPLYLGLMGTMMGIVIALFNMPDLGLELGIGQTGKTLDEGIAMLIGGVKIAMIASFMGLMLTIINSGWIFKGSRSYSESKKNDFYIFLQIELLPIINQGLASTLESLQRNLLQFNSEFSRNLKDLTGVFDSNRNAIREQKELLDAIDKAKVSEMTKYNVAVLKQLDLSVGKFEKFNAFLSNTTQFVENSQLIVTKSNELLARTENFKSIAENIDSNLNQSQQLLAFLSDHFNKLEEHKEFTSNTVADVGHSISETFKELKEHIQNSSESVKQFTIDETEALKNALSESKTNLVNLEHLAGLKADLSLFKDSSISQGNKLKLSIDELNQNMARAIIVLEQIENKKDLISKVKNLFKVNND